MLEYLKYTLKFEVFESYKMAWKWHGKMHKA